ncbi:MAG: glycosyltransferase family 4 protein [Pseudomonadota bacterium]
MRIGIYVAHVGVLPGYERMVSGHVQIPLYSARLLRDAGHEVELISTRMTGRCLPDCLPRDLPLHEVIDASRQGTASEHDVGRRGGFHPLRLVQWLRQVRALARRYDVMHFFGANRTVSLAGLIRSLPGACPTLVTFNVGVFPEPYLALTRPFWKRIDRVLTSTDYFHRKLTAAGIQSHVLRHGVVKDLRMSDVRRRHRVLFWREATPRNGGDIAAEVFRRLAPRYPNVHFDLAVRPHWSEVDGLETLAKTYPNVGLHRAPYPAGFSFEALMAEAICVLLPFRAYTVQPQLSILESLAAGVPVVASNIESTAELIQSGSNGLVIPAGDADAATRAVEELIRDPARAQTMGQAAASFVKQEWNWSSYVDELQSHYTAVLSARNLKPRITTG